MLFNSAHFLFFFLPVFLILDRLLCGKQRNYLLIIASALFYIWGEVRGLIVLTSLSIVSILFAYLINNAKSNVKKKIYFISAIIIDIGVLVYYKYFFWIVNDILNIEYFSKLQNNYVLPLGISFFTFHAISYITDIYRGIVKKHNIQEFLAYFFMFPHLVAGPIVRFESIRPYLQERKHDSSVFAYGALRFIVGLNKKMLIANSVAPFADVAFMSNPSILTTGDAWVGAIAYTIQIYFDFSGYSDMAIGLAAMMGVKFDENFNHPYQATSIRDFWRRWHISLSSWLRDYLYIPLGGSRCSKLLNFRNLFIVFFICGLWHGANYTFLAWGIFHGLLLILEKTKFGDFIKNIPLFFARLYTLTMVIVGWVFFRSDSLSQSLIYIQKMFSFNGMTPNNIQHGYINISALIIGVLIALFYRDNITLENLKNNIISYKYIITTYIIFLFSIALLYIDSRNPFIYFNF